jgi:hypothetical protein
MGVSEEEQAVGPCLGDYMLGTRSGGDRIIDRWYVKT